MNKTPERFRWAIELLKVESGDHILEIGCGTGILAELIAEKLIHGKYTGIDKSLPMLEKAIQRNKSFITHEISTFIASDFTKSVIPTSYFNKIVAFNVNFFGKNSDKELQKIKQLLKKKGKLFVLYQAPFEIDLTAAEPIKQNLIKNGFTITDIQLKKLTPTSAICIEAILI